MPGVAVPGQIMSLGGVGCRVVGVVFCIPDESAELATLAPTLLGSTSAEGDGICYQSPAARTAVIPARGACMCMTTPPARLTRSRSTNVEGFETRASLG